MRIKFIDAGGVRTRYLDAGDGEALILLHGVGMSGDVFLPNIGPLSRRFRVVAPDLCGHGFTDSVDFGSEPPPLVAARHVVELARALGLKSYAVAGSSYGALVAALMYFEAPEHATRLILIGSGSVFHPGDEQKKTLRAAMSNGLTAMADPTLDSCRQRMARITYDPTTVPEAILPVQLTAYALPDRLRAYEATIAGTIDTMDRADARVYARLEQIAAPALVITGRNDVRASCEAHMAGVTRMPDARLHIYEQCGHMPFMEHPDRFNADVAEFLTTGETSMTKGKTAGGQRQEISIPGLSPPLSHYCDAVRFGDLLFISGIAPLDENQAVIGGDDPAAQAEAIFQIMDRILKAAGAGFEDILKVTVLLTDVNDRGKINPVRQKYFGSARPASTLFEVTRLAVPGMKVEIEAVVGLRGR